MAIKDILEKKISFKSGVNNIWQINKWIPILVLYFFSFYLFAKDSFFKSDFGVFTWTQGSLIFLLTFILFGTIVFELNLLGKTKGFNLYLQIAAFCPFFLFVSRLLGRRTYLERDKADNLLDWLLKTMDWVLKYSGIKELFQSILQKLPAFLIEIISNPFLFIFIFVLLVVLSFFKTKNPKIAILVIFLLIPVADLLKNNSAKDLKYFIGASLLMLIGFSIHYKDVDKIIKEEYFLKRLTNIKDEAERIATIRILKRISENDRISDKSIIEIIRRVYEKYEKFNYEKIKLISQTIIYRLIYEHDLLKIKFDKNGIYFEISEDIRYKNFLAHSIMIIRNLTVFTLGLIYVLSPIDLIPDTIPFIGVFDDVIFGISAFQPLLEYKNKKGENKK